MTREQKLIAVTKVLDVYKKATNIFYSVFDKNKYERHVTSFGLGSTFYIFDYDINKFDELHYWSSEGISRKKIIKILKEYIQNQK